MSYPGLAQCKKCGYRFAPADTKALPIDPSSVAPRSDPQEKAASSPPDQGSSRAAARPSEFSASAAPKPQEVPAEPVDQPASSGPPWREELAERVQDHRRRRSHAQSNFDPSGTLDLAFGAAAEEPPAPIIDAQLIESPEDAKDRLDATLADSQESLPILDSVPLEKPVEDIRVLTSAGVEAGEARLGREEKDAKPVEIVLESSSPSPSASSRHRAPGSIKVAPLGLRFAAGEVDTVLLLSGA